MSLATKKMVQRYAKSSNLEDIGEEEIDLFSRHRESRVALIEPCTEIFCTRYA